MAGWTRIRRAAADSARSRRRGNCSDRANTEATAPCCMCIQKTPNAITGFFMGARCVQYAPDSINTVTPMSR